MIHLKLVKIAEEKAANQTHEEDDGLPHGGKC